jgi:hypothetical protein
MRGLVLTTDRHRRAWIVRRIGRARQRHRGQSGNRSRTVNPARMVASSLSLALAPLAPLVTAPRTVPLARHAILNVRCAPEAGIGDIRTEGGRGTSAGYDAITRVSTLR